MSLRMRNCSNRPGNWWSCQPKWQFPRHGWKWSEATAKRCRLNWLVPELWKYYWCIAAESPDWRDHPGWFPLHRDRPKVPERADQWPLDFASSAAVASAD